MECVKNYIFTSQWFRTILVHCYTKMQIFISKLSMLNICALLDKVGEILCCVNSYHWIAPPLEFSLNYGLENSAN